MKQLLYIDLFCGAGGTSTGVERATLNGKKCAEVIACVNHDKNAIASHAANHPHALHFIEDIRTLDLTQLVEHTNNKRAANPDALVVLWASLECTNFSKAKGGMPRDADSRTLAEHLFRYIEALTPDYIYIENVEEFMCWGDLDENGKPVSKDRGRLYMKWINNVCKYGYRFAHRLLNSANYGAYTSRTRFFGIFAKDNLPIVFPDATHCKNGKQDMFNNLQAWKPVKEVLELEDEGKSIFDREKPLVDRTLERIYAGLIKFVAGGKDAFLVKYNSMNQGGKYTPPSIDEPCPTVATQNRLGVAKVQFLSKQFGGDPNGKSISVNEPCGTNENAALLAQIKWLDNQRIRFGCDTLRQIDDCVRAMYMIEQHGFHGQFFLYCMLNSDFEESFKRVNYWWIWEQRVRSSKQGCHVYAYAQPYRDPNNPRTDIPQWQKDMAGWVNKKAHFVAHSFESFEPRKGFRCAQYFSQHTPKLYE